MRIYMDESGTHGMDYLIIGGLFVPEHGVLHAELLKAKEELGYYNKSARHAQAKYKETHLAEFRSKRDVDLGKRWIDAFGASNAYFRCIVIHWPIWEGKYFGTPFEPEALKKRRAYKKWAEMLLHPEVSTFRGATLYLDRLRICHGYDVLEQLKERFGGNYQGVDPWIKKFELAESWKDGNQCLQLADLLTGCVFRKLIPPSSPEKMETVDYLYEKLKTFGVKERTPGYWAGFAKKSLSKHFPKFSEWYWRPGV